MQTTDEQQSPPLIGVLALQGAFEEHQKCLEAIGCRTVQVRTPKDLTDLDGIVLPGGESTAMGLIGGTTTTASSTNGQPSGTAKSKSMWDCLREFGGSSGKPMWGTCAGMILLAEQCVGTSATIENGQSLIGGMNVLVCRNYFGSQVSSFEMATPPPPPLSLSGSDTAESPNEQPFPGVFIRAPAILSAGPNVQVLGRVVATPCRQAATVLHKLEQKIQSGQDDIVVASSSGDSRGVADQFKFVVSKHSGSDDDADEEEKKESTNDNEDSGGNEGHSNVITLPGAAEDGTNARQVICAVRRDNLLCTAFHPELTDDYRWHEYFVQEMVLKKKMR